MEILLHSFLTVLNLFLIVGCCVVFTNAVEHLGKIYNLNEGAVGSILAAVGTALPETIVPLVAIIGAYFAHTDVAVGKEIGIGAILGAPFLLSTLAMFVTGLAVVIFWKMGIRERKMNANYVVMFRDLKFFFFSYTLAIAAGFIPFKPLKYICAAALFGYYILYVFRTLNCAHCEGMEGEELDELLFLSGLHNKEQLRAVVVGGAALLLMGYIDRSTKDIDFIEVSREAEKFLPEFDINTNVTAYLNDFPDDYDERLVALPIGGKKIKYYAMSLEDIVIAKAGFYRDTDMNDIRSQKVINNLDFALLDRLAEEKALNALNDTQSSIFRAMYRQYRKEAAEKRKEAERK